MEEFYPGQSYCKTCAKLRADAWNKNNRERTRKANKRWQVAHPQEYQEHCRRQNLRRYGLTPEQYDELLRKQGGVCAICKRPETKLSKSEAIVRRLSVDHQHDETKKVRGLLCAWCNRFLGVLELKGPEWFQKAQEYLDRPSQS